MSLKSKAYKSSISLSNCSISWVCLFARLCVSTSATGSLLNTLFISLSEPSSSDSSSLNALITASLKPCVSLLAISSLSLVIRSCRTMRFSISSSAGLVSTGKAGSSLLSIEGKSASSSSTVLSLNTS